MYFFSVLVHVNLPKQHKSIEQAGYKLLSKLYLTYKTKQINKFNF